MNKAQSSNSRLLASAALLIALAVARPALADPVYLTCDHDFGGGTHSRYLVTLDYAAGTLEMNLLPNMEPVRDRNGRSVLPMTVTALAITWERHNSGGTVLHGHIDRSTGDMTGFLSDERNVVLPDDSGSVTHCQPGPKPDMPTAKF